MDLWQVSASCCLSLQACNQSLLTRALSIDSRAYVISLHACWPIRTPSPACANQDARVVITSKRPKSNSIHTVVRHALTRSPARNIVQKTILFVIHFSISLIWFWPSCHFDLGGLRHGWGLFLEQADSLQINDVFHSVNRTCLFLRDSI